MLITAALVLQPPYLTDAPPLPRPRVPGGKPPSAAGGTLPLPWPAAPGFGIVEKVPPFEGGPRPTTPPDELVPATPDGEAVATPLLEVCCARVTGQSPRMDVKSVLGVMALSLVPQLEYCCM